MGPTCSHTIFFLVMGTMFPDRIAMNTAAVVGLRGGIV